MKDSQVSLILANMFIATSIISDKPFPAFLGLVWLGLYAWQSYQEFQS